MIILGAVAIICCCNMQFGNEKDVEMSSCQLQSYVGRSYACFHVEVLHSDCCMHCAFCFSRHCGRGWLRFFCGGCLCVVPLGVGSTCCMGQEMASTQSGSPLFSAPRVHSCNNLYLEQAANIILILIAVPKRAFFLVQCSHPCLGILPALVSLVCTQLYFFRHLVAAVGWLMRLLRATQNLWAQLFPRLLGLVREVDGLGPRVAPRLLSASVAVFYAF